MSREPGAVQECAPLLVREQRLLTEVLTKCASCCRFALLGFDTDNDSVFMNETVRDYCQAAGVVFTRCRPYRKNDQAWVEQKNGAVVRRMVGYRRFEGLEAAAALARLYAAVAAVRELLPTLVQAGGRRRVTGRRSRSATIRRRRRYQRLLADPRTAEEVRQPDRGDATRRWIRFVCCSRSAPRSSGWSRSPTGLMQQR